MVESLQSEDVRSMNTTEDIEKENAGEEVKKEKHCSSIVRRWWSKDDDFQRKAEANIDNGKEFRTKKKLNGRLSGEERKKDEETRHE